MATHAINGCFSYFIKVMPSRHSWSSTNSSRHTIKGPSKQYNRIVGENSYRKSSSSTWKSREYITNSWHHTLQQNGIAERANWTIAEATHAMLQTAGMSQGFWECAVATAVHIWNCAPSHITGNISPHEWLLDNHPISHTCGPLAVLHMPTPWLNEANLIQHLRS